MTTINKTEIENRFVGIYVIDLIMFGVGLWKYWVKKNVAHTLNS